MNNNTKYGLIPIFLMSAFLLTNFQAFSTTKVLHESDFQQGAAYIIIAPDEFVSQLQILKSFRIAQGISTCVVSTNETGTTVEEIKTFILDAYNNWVVAPVALFLVGGVEFIPAPIWENYCYSDNFYADMDGDDLPELTIGRLPVNTIAQLDQYLQRIMAFENNPLVDSCYYNYPLAVSNYENTSSSSWMLAEILNGWYASMPGKSPVREYVGQQAPENWPDEDLYLAFGPDGLNYIPESPAYLAGYSGGSAQGINYALNSGALSFFNFAQGNVNGWYSPDYFIENLSGLSAAPPTFLISLGSLTGNFGFSGGDCFAEAFILHPFGGTGAIAASEVVYSIGSSWFVAGIIDGLWDDFFPGISNFHSTAFKYPSEALVSAKYFLSGLSIPINPQIRKSFYYLYNYFGEPFVPFSDRLPENLTVVYDSLLIPGQTEFTVQADSGALISLVLNGEISALEVSSGALQNISLPGLMENDILQLTITGCNYRRFHVEMICLGPTKLQADQLNQCVLSPNPANEYLNIDFGCVVKIKNPIRIFNTKGEEMHINFECFQGDVQTLNIPLSEIENGIYMVQFMLENKLFTSKFEVRR